MATNLNTKKTEIFQKQQQKILKSGISIAEVQSSLDIPKIATGSDVVTILIRRLLCTLSQTRFTMALESCFELHLVELTLNTRENRDD